MADPFSDFEDQFKEASDSQNPPPKPAAPSSKKTEKGVPWEAKVIDGVYYIPLSQVADLLKENDILPAVRRGIEIRVQAQKERKQFGIT